MLFDQLSAEQAGQYRDHIVARERPRLSDLAHWMSDDGGPIEEMNGTPESLVPLWSWFRGFLGRDFPGVELAGPPSVLAVYDPYAVITSEETRESYVRESIEHYFAKVVFRLDPGAQWTVYESTARGAIDIEHRETGVMTSSGRFILVNREINAITDRMKEGKEQGAPTEALKAKLERYAGWIDLEAADLSVENILTGFLSEPRIPVDDPARQLPVITEAVPLSPAPKADRAGGSVLLFGGYQTDVDTPLGQLPVLPAASVASALSAAGFVGPADEPLESTSLLTDGATFEHLKGWAAAWTAVSRKKLRTVTIRALDATEGEWKSLLLPLREFAASIDATLE